ncbi:MAG: hypothetical protein FJ152_03130 [Firmicutes bacterium]|nr:hypothetical protein [Bacillota bacterium]
MRIMKFLFFMFFGLIILIIASYAIPLPASMPQAWSGDRNLFTALAALFYGLISLVWLYIFIVRGAWRNAGQTITELATLGFSLKEKNLFLRRLKTIPGIRPAEVTIRPAYRLEPWRVEIRVEPAYDGYLAMGIRKPLLVKRDMTELLIDSFPYNEMQILAEDEAAATLFLTAPAVEDHFATFINQLGAVSGWEIYFEPKRVWASIRTYHLITWQVTEWVESLLQLPALKPVREGHELVQEYCEKYGSDQDEDSVEAAKKILKKVPFSLSEKSTELREE